jgi:uncharacterized membrane protein YeaQ/YmgE (transglycosylase-associated protein family)
MQALMNLGGGVGFFGTLLIGAIAGWIAEKVTSSSHGLIMNIIVGITGAYLGGFLANAMGLQLGEIFSGWFWGNLIISAIGAVILLGVYRIIKSR